MGLIKTYKTVINEDKYAYPDPEIIIQTTRNPNNVNLLGTGAANNDNGYIYFYVDSLWKTSPFAYVGESKNGLQSRHNSTHKNSQWFKVIEYPFIGIINSPNKPWDTDTRRAIESLTIHKLHSIGIEMINSANSTWVNGGTIHPNVNNKYVEDIANIIVEYITHHIGYYATKKPELVVTESTKKNKLKNHSSHRLKDIVESGLLAPQVIYSTSPTYPTKAEITVDGDIMLDGIIYTSVSSAGIAAIQKISSKNSSVNGWDFWSTKQPDGTYKKLSQWREEYDKLKNQI